MMIGPKNAAIAIRKPDGEIVVEKRPVPKKGRVSKLPIIRGFVGIFKQMVLGIKALMYSAEFVDLEDDKDKEPSKVDKFLDRILGDKLQDVLIYISVIFSIIFSVFLFMVLPNLVASILPVDKSTGVGTLIYNVVEGVVRVGIFIGYLALTSLMKDKTYRRFVGNLPGISLT